MSNTYVTSLQINYGKRIIPIKMVELFSADEWEEFIEEWLSIKKSIYFETEKFGGAGDQGRDVVGYLSDKNSPNYDWDCYQCKHYDKPLMPTQVYQEFAKIIYYSFLQEFAPPKKYFFVAPKGCGTSLSKLLQDGALLKDAIKNNWDKWCKSDITNVDVELSGKFLQYFDKFDFSCFSKIHVKDVIEDHKKHPNHIVRFGGGLPERERLDESAIPSEVQPNEIIYVDELIKAYSSHSGVTYFKSEDFSTSQLYYGHFNRARISFHYAEQLRNFYRDSLPVNTFEDFQNEILAGIIDLVEEIHSDGFVKVKEVEKEARKIAITSNPLKDVSITSDRNGICHQLVNDKKIKWV